VEPRKEGKEGKRRKKKKKKEKEIYSKTLELVFFFLF